MNGWIGFVRTTIVGGILFLVPLIVLVMILGKAYSLMKQVTAPLSRFVPVETVGAIAVVDVLAIALILLVCFLAGMFARREIAGRLVSLLETRLLSRIPIYDFVKGTTASFVEAENNEAMTPVLAQFDDQAQIAFEIERLETGEVVIYLPGAPNPWSGSVCVLAAERVRALDATMVAAIGSIRHLGRGAKTLIADRAPAG